jgi:hypothetical protein
MFSTGYLWANQPPIVAPDVPGAVDYSLFVVAILANLLMIGVFVAKARRLARLQYALGVALEVLALPLVVAIVLNALWQREWWTVALPLAMIAFLAVEFLFDYVWRLDFRRGRLLGPYLALYYVGFIALTGYAFSLGKPYGFAALATYFANLAATAYSYSRVGHGSGPRRGARPG